MLTNPLLTGTPSDPKYRPLVSNTSSQSCFCLLTQFGPRSRLVLHGGQWPTVSYDVTSEVSVRAMHLPVVVTSFLWQRCWHSGGQIKPPTSPNSFAGQVHTELRAESQERVRDRASNRAGISCWDTCVKFLLWLTMSRM